MGFTAGRRCWLGPCEPGLCCLLAVRQLWTLTWSPGDRTPWGLQPNSCCLQPWDWNTRTLQGTQGKQPHCHIYNTSTVGSRAHQTPPAGRPSEARTGAFKPPEANQNILMVSPVFPRGKGVISHKRVVTIIPRGWLPIFLYQSGPCRDFHWRPRLCCGTF